MSAVHKWLDGLVAGALTGFLVLEHVLGVDTIPEVAMTTVDAGLHVLIIGVVLWHLATERNHDH